MFLGLDRLVQSALVAASQHQAAGELIDDNDLAVFNDVFFVPLISFFGGYGVPEVVQEAGILLVVDCCRF